MLRFDNIAIPDGWRQVGYRVPTFEDYFLVPAGIVYGVALGGPQSERIIVEQLPIEQESVTHGRPA